MTGGQGEAALESARRLLADATGCAVSDVDDQAAIGSFELWDSLAHMRLILAIEAETGSTIAPDKVVELTSLADVAGLLASQPQDA